LLFRNCLLEDKDLEGRRESGVRRVEALIKKAALLVAKLVIEQSSRET